MEENKEQKVWVTISETIKTGDYENVKIEMGFSRAYDKEKPNELIQDGFDNLKSIIDKEAKVIRKKARRRNKRWN